MLISIHSVITAESADEILIADHEPV